MSRSSELVIDFMTYHLSSLYPSGWLRPHQDFQRSLRSLESYSHRDIDKWLEVPVSYLSCEEALLVGITLYFSSSKSNSPKACIAHFEAARESQSDVIRSISHFALGILSLEKAKLEKLESEYHCARRYFEAAIASNCACHYSKLALSICYVALGGWAQVPKLLLQVSRFHYRPGPIYQTLAQIYERLGLEGPNQFYALKAKKAELSSAFLFS